MDNTSTIKDMLKGVDGTYSLSRGMATVWFLVLVFSWFYFPNRDLDWLLMVFGTLMGYALGDKVSNYKFIKGQANCPPPMVIQDNGQTKPFLKE